jgi:hypothetical protein
VQLDPAEDLARWIPKPEAARRLGVTERTVDRMIAAGKLRRQWRRIAGRRDQAVIHPGDVEAIEAATAAPPASPPPAAADAAGAEVIAAALDRLARALKPPPLWLTLDEAVEYSGLSMELLKQLIRARKLPLLRDGARKVRRRDLERLSIRLHEISAIRGA